MNGHVHMPSLRVCVCVCACIKHEYIHAGHYDQTTKFNAEKADENKVKLTTSDE